MSFKTMFRIAQHDSCNHGTNNEQMTDGPTLASIACRAIKAGHSKRWTDAG